MQQTTKIKENRDFRRIYARGRSFVSPSLVIYIMKNKTGKNRIGITVGKKTGNAVKRNRAKRIIKEAYRLLEMKVNTGLDIVMVARKKAVYMNSCNIMDTMERIFVKAGVISK